MNLCSMNWETLPYIYSERFNSVNVRNNTVYNYKDDILVYNQKSLVDISNYKNILYIETIYWEDIHTRELKANQIFIPQNS